jgi:hypothetical protein
MIDYYYINDNVPWKTWRGQRVLSLQQAKQFSMTKNSQTLEEEEE